MEKIKTLFISDVHLGSTNSNPKKLLEVFKKYEFENLIINGDFIDLTSLKRRFFWNQDHSTVIQKVLRASRKGVNVTYILGNHDFYLRGLIKDENINLIDKEIVAKARSIIEKMNENDFNKQFVESSLKDCAKSEGLKIGDVMKSVRICLTGEASSPSVFEIIAIIGKKETLNRIDAVE
jgi:glutamyl/glutaminyl-tRNA synthetase